MVAGPAWAAADTYWPAPLVEQGFQPSRLAGPQPPLFSLASPPAPVALEGLDLHQSGEILHGEPAMITGAGTLDITLYWRPTGAPPKDARLAVRIQGTGPAFTGETFLPVEAWRLGELRTAHIEITLLRLRYSGRATLTVAYAVEDNDQPQLLYAAPVHILPEPVTSPVESDDLEDFFAFPFFRLGRAFRLGPGASITVPLPRVVQDGFRAIGVVSSTEYDGSSYQGLDVCLLEFLDSSGNVVASASLRAGITIAPSDREKFPEDRRTTRPVRVFQSRPSEQPNRFDGKPFNLNTYGAVLPVRAARAVSVRATSTLDAGLVEIRDIVFAPDDRP